MTRNLPPLLLVIGLAQASPTLALTFEWTGADCYNCVGSWTPAEVPDSPGEDAVFGNGGTNSVLVGTAVNPSSWVFAANAPDYVIVGASVSFDGAGLINNAAELIAISNNLGGTGAVVKNNALGTLALYGDNSYTGGTTINGGTLSVDVDANLGALSGPLTIGNGTLNTKTTFATSRTVTLTGNASLTQAVATRLTLDGVIDGPGSLTLEGDGGGGGRVTLSGNNTYTGGTNLNSGTLSINADSNLGAQSGPLTIGNGTLSTQQTFASNRLVNLTGDATFTQTAGTDFTLNGEIGGSGSLTQRGDGALFLSGNNSYTGTTELNSGSLFVNSSITASSQLSTTPTTFLGGIGTLPQSTVSGSLSPGAARGATGTLSIAGNLTTTSTAGYMVDFNPGSAPDLIHASGSATLNGADATTSLNGFIPVVNLRYAILSADGGVNGTFTYEAQHLPLSDIDLTYDANNVYFLVARNRVPIGGTPEHPIVIPPGGGTPEHPIAITPPQTSTGGGVDELPPDNPILGAIVLLPTVGEIRDALDQLSGQIYPSQQTLLLEDSHFARDAVNERLDGQLDGSNSSDLKAGNTLLRGTRPIAWVQSTNAFAEQGDALDNAGDMRFGVDTFLNSDAALQRTAWMQGTGAHRKQGDLSDNTGGTFFGIDSRITDTATLGILGGYTRSEVDMQSGSSSIDNYTLGTYVGELLGPWVLKAGTTYTRSEIDTSRTVNFTGFSDSLDADYSANTAQVFSGVGYRINAGPTVVEPYADLAWVQVSADGFTEHGGPAALSVGDNSHDATFSTLGVRPSYAFVFHDMPAKVKGGLGWRHTFGDLEPTDSMSFAPTGTFGMPAVPLAEDVAIVSLGLEAALTSSASLSLAYNGQFGSDTQENGLTGLFQVKF